MPRMASARSGSSRIVRVVLAILSAPRAFKVPGQVAEGGHGAGCDASVDGGGVLGEGDISDVVAGVFHSPVPSDRGGQVGRAGLVGVKAGDGVDAFAALAPPADFLAAAVDTDGQGRVEEGNAAEFVGDGAGLDRARLAAARTRPDRPCSTPLHPGALSHQVSQPSPDPDEQGDCSDHPKRAAYTKKDYPGRGGRLPLTLEVGVINKPPVVSQDQKANYQHEGGKAQPDNDVVTEFRSKVHFHPFVRS